MIDTPVQTATVTIDGNQYILTVFENGSKKYTVTSELPNGTHTMTSFIYDGVEYLTSPMAFEVENAKVKQITILNSGIGSGRSRSIRSIVYEDLDFGYGYMEFEERQAEQPETFVVPFHVLLGVPADELQNYLGSHYENQPNGLQTFMKGIFRVQYYHNGVYVANYGVLNYNDGATNVTYMEGDNVFQIQHLRWLDGIGVVEVVSTDFHITGDLITGDNGLVNIDIVPDPTWIGDANYTMYY